VPFSTQALEQGYFGQLSGDVPLVVVGVYFYCTWTGYATDGQGHEVSGDPRRLLVRSLSDEHDSQQLYLTGRQ
jgi:hypothetical protein